MKRAEAHRTFVQNSHTADGLGLSARGSATHWRFCRGLGIFKSNLETTLWALRGDKVSGGRPWTGKAQIGDWIKELASDRPQLPPHVQDVLRG